MSFEKNGNVRCEDLAECLLVFFCESGCLSVFKWFLLVQNRLGNDDCTRKEKRQQKNTTTVS